MKNKKLSSKKEFINALKSLQGSIKFEGDAVELLRTLRKNPNMEL